VITWPLDLTVYAGLVALFLGHAWLASRAPDAERKHTLYFGLGLLTLWVALETPIDPISDYYLDSVHMLQHVLLGFVGPPLMLLGLSPNMAARLSRLPGVRAITEPVPAQLIAGSIMIGWHVPAFYDATLYSGSLHVVEHVMFMAGGVLLYWPLVESTSAVAHWRMSPGAKLVYMLVATLPQDGVALALLFSRVPFYEYYAYVLMILGKATLAVAATAVFFRWFGGEHRADEDGPAHKAESSIRG
jgi:cytochrome c oxidase assembly factor CtaG